MADDIVSVALSSKQSPCGPPVTLRGPHYTTVERNSLFVTGNRFK